MYLVQWLLLHLWKWIWKNDNNFTHFDSATLAHIIIMVLFNYRYVLDLAKTCRENALGQFSPTGLVHCACRVDYYGFNVPFNLKLKYINYEQCSLNICLKHPRLNFIGKMEEKKAIILTGQLEVGSWNCYALILIIINVFRKIPWTIMKSKKVISLL